MRDATAMCDAIRIAHPQIASDVKKFFSLAMPKDIRLIWNHRKMPEKKACENPAMLACDAKNRVFLRSSDAKCLRFGLPLRFGLRCEHPRCQIASDVGRAMRTTKGGAKPWSANRELGTFSLENSSVSVHSLHFMVCAPLRKVSLLGL